MQGRHTWPLVATVVVWTLGIHPTHLARAQAISDDEDGNVAGLIGPDVIVGEINGIKAWGSWEVPEDSGNYISAFSVGTTSCNIGDDPLSWHSSSNQHPAIRSTMYRLKSGRFEQIGLSWVKHGFFATNEVICDLDCQKPPGYTAGAELFPGCSDPYFASLNGNAVYLGPTAPINAFTGAFPYPPTRPAQLTRIEQRLQVHDYDLDLTLNEGASYYVDGQYVTPDDAAAGNGMNSVSYRPITILPGDSVIDPHGFNSTITGSTIQEQPAIRAWRARDPTVFINNGQVPGEGLFILGAKVSDLGTGFWHYEYALYNMNSDRSGRSFTVPVSIGAVVQNIEFHDVDYHSGELGVDNEGNHINWDGTDWSTSTLTGKVVWETEDFATNPNANALRWGTLYNFRFDSTAPPSSTIVTLGLFKPGFPSDITIVTVGPSVGFIDCNQNGVSDPCDVQCGGNDCPVQGCGLSEDCNSNGVPDECEADCNGNNIADPCDLSSNTSDDCNSNTVPDECESDCNHNNVPDTCETIPDSDGDGVDDCADLCPLTTPSGACVPPPLVGCFGQSGLCAPDQPISSCLAGGGIAVCDPENPGTCFGPPPPCIIASCRSGCLIGDADGDGDIDLADFDQMLPCFSGAVGSPAFVIPPTVCLTKFDFNSDGAVDWFDYEAFTRQLAGPAEAP